MFCLKKNSCFYISLQLRQTEFTKQQLMDEVWGYETEADPHTIEVHIGRIRERLKDNPDFEIVTMRGIGYKVVKK